MGDGGFRKLTPALNRIVTAAALAALTTSCGGRATPASSVAPATPLASRTIALPPAAAATSRPIVPTATRTLQIPTPTITHLPASETGPWLVLHERGQGAGQQALYVVDVADGGATAADIPVPQSPGEFSLFVAPSPAYPYVAVTWSDWELDFRLLVLHLPDLEPVADFRLLGDSAQNRIATFVPEWEGQEPPVLTRIRHSLEEVRWSPNGRYLAFVGALDGPSADVYVFDAATQTVRRLTDGPNQAYLMGWSPDSRWIVHASIFFEDVELAMEAVWAASPSTGQVAYLYPVPEYASDERLLGWRNASQFLAQSGYFEACSGDVYQVSIPDGDLTPLLTQQNAGATFDPVNGSIAFTVDPDGFCRSEDPGVFVLDLDSGRSTHVLAGEYYWVDWSSDASALRTIDWSTEEEVYFTSGGRIIARFPRCCGAEPSPNGEYFAVPQEDHLVIQARGGAELARLPVSESAGLLWLPDASGFVRWWRSGDGVVHVETRLARLGWGPASSTEFGTFTSPDGAWIVWPQAGGS